MEPHARFDALYREHAGAVARYVRRRCEPQAADDVVADVFVVALRRLDEVPADPLHLPAPGCWRLTLRWSGWADQLDLRYSAPR